jgi:hypothetical protein
MNDTQQQVVPEKEEKPRPRPRPVRRRPADNYNEALLFIATAVGYMNEQKDPLHTGNLEKVKPLYSNYCRNTGLRGKAKESVWRIVKSQLDQVKADSKKKV